MDDVAGRVGVGTDSPTHRLHVAGSSGLRQNETYLSGGPGWSSLTYNAFHNGVSREVPYLSPLAWGYYGLTLPRYPGTHVLLLAGPVGTNDYVDVVALWSRGDGPKSKSKVGDYWLVLPIGLTNREDIGDDTGHANDASATHDLIDGVRIVEAKQFVIRVTDDLTTASGRPKVGDALAGGLLIEAKSGDSSALIPLAPDGTVTVKGTSITFDTGERETSR